MTAWTFLGLAPHSELPLEVVRRADISERPGVYVLSAAEGVRYQYPKGHSSIFYIGESSSLRSRLGTHRTRTLAVRNRTQPLIEWPRYEYAAAHGCLVAAFPAAHDTVSSSLDLESDVVALFAATFGAPPIANGSANRDKVLRRTPMRPPAGLTNDSWI